MKKLRQIIALALVLGCASALAEWTEIDRFEDGTRIYADRGNTQRNGDISQVLHLVRWGEAQADPGQAPYLSTLVRTAYDCANKHEKYLASTSFAHRDVTQTTFSACSSDQTGAESTANT